MSCSWIAESWVVTVAVILNGGLVLGMVLIASREATAAELGEVERSRDYECRVSAG